MLIPLNYLIEQYQLRMTGVLHVGAHECEERNDYHRAGLTDDNIFWIEGNQDLVKKMQAVNPTIQIYHALVSDKDDQPVDFIITNNGQSSSILELGTHKQEHPHVVEVERRRATTTRLDTLIERQIIAKDCQQDSGFRQCNFLNLDIQGAELLALHGLGKYLDQFDYVYSEVNTQPLYVNCSLFGDMVQFMAKNNFRLVTVRMTKHGWGDAFWINRHCQTSTVAPSTAHLPVTPKGST